MKGVTVPMESYRLAQYAVEMPCYVCDELSASEAEQCRHCQAPMALAHQAHSQKLRPQMVAALGSSGVGKTVYLGMLMDMLSRKPERMQLLARGAFSVTLQQSVISALAQCEFPPKTPNEPDRWNWVHCQVRAPHQRRPSELVMPDMAGESVLHEIEHPGSYPSIRSLLRKCQGVLLLVDAAELEDGRRDQDYFAMKLLSYLSELDEHGQSWKRRPVALVFSKADQSERCFDDPAAYAQRHAAGLWRHCTERFQVHRYFASGVAGACVTRHVPGRGRMYTPLRIEPRGIVEPFEWLLSHFKGG